MCKGISGGMSRYEMKKWVGIQDQTKYAKTTKPKVSLTSWSNRILINWSYFNVKETLKVAMPQYERMPSNMAMP